MKILYFYPCIFLSLFVSLLSSTIAAYDGCFATAFSAGYVFKHSDHLFKDVYGRGMGNVITGDFCYYPWQCWGFGTKISYWLAAGKTTFFKRHTFLQEVPLTAYVRRAFNFESCLQLYASLGGGAAWIKEESYLAHIHQWRGIGELEFGLNYPISICIDFTSAIRYLFPRQSEHCETMNPGGFDLRAGISIVF